MDLSFLSEVLSVSLPALTAVSPHRSSLMGLLRWCSATGAASFRRSLQPGASSTATRAPPFVLANFHAHSCVLVRPSPRLCWTRVSSPRPRRPPRAQRRSLRARLRLLRPCPSLQHADRLASGLPSPSSASTSGHGALLVLNAKKLRLIDASGECGNRQSLCVVNDQPVGNPKRKV
jgi:hypothetical protein